MTEAKLDLMLMLLGLSAHVVVIDNRHIIEVFKEVSVFIVTWWARLKAMVRASWSLRGFHFVPSSPFLAPFVMLSSFLSPLTN